MIGGASTFDAPCIQRWLRRRVMIVLLMAAASSGCATIFSGTHQVFLLRSDNPNTVFSVDGRDLGTGVVTLPIARRALGRTAFSATAPGCAAVTSRVERKLDGVWFTGMIFWPAMIVDVLTGSFRMAKRTVFILNPKCPEP